MNDSVNKITIHNHAYDIADATAREILDNKVSKSGDTMTGALTISQATDNKNAVVRVEDAWSDNTAVSLQVGTGGHNRGVYDDSDSKWMLYTDSSDNVHLGTSTIGSSYRPVYLNAGVPTQCATTAFYTAGDTFNIMFYGAGYVTNGGETVHITVSVAKPLSGVSSLSVTSKGSATIRQNGSYCYGSSSTSGVTPSSITVQSFGSGTGILHITLEFTNTTNVTNNSAIGVALSSTTISCS